MPRSNTRKPFGPDVVLEFPSTASGVAVWAKVSATDDTGVAISNIEKGDIVRVEAIAGFCSFSDKSFVDKLKSVAGIVGGILTSGLPLFSTAKAKAVAEALKKGSTSLESYSGGKGKVRTGYGKVRGKGKYATKEGGIIICMPSARGPVYAADDTYLDGDAEQFGRLPQYVPAHLRDWCFFPCRRPGGAMEKTALQDGPVYVLVFDKEHGDNAGAYEIKLTVTRPGRAPEDIQEELSSSFSDAGL